MMKHKKILISYILSLVIFGCGGGSSSIDISDELSDFYVELEGDLKYGGEIREEAIIKLDNELKNNAARSSVELMSYYKHMLGQVATEMKEEVDSGIRIWSMYNHGFIIKTPDTIFAVDLVKGYYGWENSVNFPTEILEMIDVLLITHEHGDHNDPYIINQIINNSGYVVGPSETNIGNTPLAVGEFFQTNGLKITAHDGVHSVPLRMYEIETSNGIKIFHTGDNQMSSNLPTIENLDVLLLNAWINESGSSHATTGMRNAIEAMNPKLMIPGHIQELGHEYDPQSNATRVPYEWALDVDDIQLNADVSVLTWGENLFYSK